MLHGGALHLHTCVPHHPGHGRITMPGPMPGSRLRAAGTGTQLITRCLHDRIVHGLQGKGDLDTPCAMQQQQQQFWTSRPTVTPATATAQAQIHAGPCREEVRKVQQGLPWPSSGSGSENGEATENRDAGSPRDGGSDGRRFMVDEFEQAAMSPEGVPPCLVGALPLLWCTILDRCGLDRIGLTLV